MPSPRLDSSAPPRQRRRRPAAIGWRGASALVTGASSGIGRALSRELWRRGAVVWLADLDGDGVSRAAAELGERAHPVELDVRDTTAVEAAVARVVAEHGRLDLLFNNAGIAIAGEAHELTAAHYDRILDVNVRGVTNGTAAAYPRMRDQGSGRIVNTCSMAGLMPVPLLAAYAMTKHAVVGLSLSLRIEARRHGVGVHAVCPSTVATPMLTAPNPSDLPPSWRPDHRQFLSAAAGEPYPPERLAIDVLRGVERDHPVIVAPRRARWIALLYRWWPGLVLLEVRRSLESTLAARPRE